MEVYLLQNFKNDYCVLIPIVVLGLKRYNLFCSWMLVGISALRNSDI